MRLRVRLSGPCALGFRVRAPARAAINCSGELASRCLSGNATVRKAKWLPWAREASEALLPRRCPRRPPDVARGSQLGRAAPQLSGRPRLPLHFPRLARRARRSHRLGVEAAPRPARPTTCGPPRRGEGESKGARCPRGAERGSCGPSPLGSLWTLGAGLQNRPGARAVDTRGGQLDAPTTRDHSRPPLGGPACAGLGGFLGEGLSSQELGEGG